MRITPSFLCFFLIFFAAVTADPAPSSPADTYIVARDRYLAEFKAHPAADAADKREQKALADLERLLTAAVPAWSAPGFPANGTINLDTLDEGDIGFGALDGVSYQAGDTTVVATTRPLLMRWLANHRNWHDGAAKVPVSVPVAFRAENFWTFVRTADAAAQMFGMVLVKAPGADVAMVLLAVFAQDLAMDEGPSMLLATVVRGDRVLIAEQKLTVALDKPAMCKKALDQTRAKSEKALKDYQIAKAKDPKAFDMHEQLEHQADHDYRACFALHLPEQTNYAAVQKQAQALVDLLH
jgi:hypothetical protein